MLIGVGSGVPIKSGRLGVPVSSGESSSNSAVKSSCQPRSSDRLYIVPPVTPFARMALKLVHFDAVVGSPGPG